MPDGLTNQGRTSKAHPSGLGSHASLQQAQRVGTGPDRIGVHGENRARAQAEAKPPANRRRFPEISGVFMRDSRMPLGRQVSLRTDRRDSAGLQPLRDRLNYHPPAPSAWSISGRPGDLNQMVLAGPWSARPSGCRIRRQTTSRQIGRSGSLTLLSLARFSAEWFWAGRHAAGYRQPGSSAGMLQIAHQMRP